MAHINTPEEILTPDLNILPFRESLSFSTLMIKPLPQKIHRAKETDWSHPALQYALAAHWAGQGITEFMKGKQGKGNYGCNQNDWQNLEKSVSVWIQKGFTWLEAGMFGKEETDKQM